MSDPAAVGLEFELLEPIGRGGLGVVWLARHRRTGTNVALKAILADRAQRPDYQRSFRDELRAFSAMNHPHIVPVLDYGRVSEELAASSDGELAAETPFLVMEYLEAGALDVEQVLPWPLLKAVLEQLLEALAHAHSFGLIHRDIKPANVLISGVDPFRVKLTDFGIAVRLHEEEAEDRARGASSGTPTYMAPEQFRGAWRDFGPWTDFYALGCLAWELATGAPPFRGATLVRLAQQHSTAPLPAFLPRSPIPPGFERWLAELLRKDPFARPVFAADALAALRDLPDVVEPPSGAAKTTLGEAQFAETLLDTTEELDPFGDTQATTSPSAQTDVDVAVGTGLSPLPAVGFPVDGYADVEPSMPALPGVGAGIFAVRTIPLVDREGEREQVWQALRGVQEAEMPRLILLRGGAGVGKTRFAMWAVRRAHELGAADFLRVQCVEHDVPGQALRRALAGRLHLAGLTDAGALALIEHRVASAGHSKLVARLLTSWLTGTTGAQHATMRDRLQAALWLLRDFARQRALVLVVDDLQWGIELQDLLVDILRTEKLPILVLATVRDESVSDAVEERLAELDAVHSARTLDVTPLASTDTRQLVSTMVGAEPEFVSHVCDRAQGNPLFAVELVSEAIRRELLIPADTGFKVPAGAQIPISENVQQIFSARLGAIEGRHHAVARALELAAVLGGEWSEREWEHLCVSAAVPLQPAAVDDVVRSGLADFRDGTWSFRHPLLADVLIERASAAGDLRRWHELAGRTVWALGLADDVSVWDRVAFHRVAAGDFSGALPLLAKLGEQLNTRGEFVRAEAVWRRWFAAAEALALDEEDPSRVGALLGFAWSRGSRGDPGALEGLKAAGALAERRGDPLLRGDVDYTWGVALFTGDMYEEAASHAAAALRWYREGNAPLAKIARALRVNGRVLVPLDPERAIGFLQEALDVAVASGDPLSEAKCLAELASVRVERTDEAREMLRRARDIFQGLMAREGVMHCTSVLGGLAEIEGEHAAAEAYFRDAMAHARAMQQLSIDRIHGSILQSMVMQGDLARAAAAVDPEIEALSRRQRSPQALANTLTLHTALLLFTESPDAAHTEAELVAHLRTGATPSSECVSALQMFPEHICRRVSKLVETHASS